MLKKPVLHFNVAREGKAKALLDTRHSKIQEVLGCRVLVENVDCVGLLPTDVEDLLDLLAHSDDVLQSCHTAYRQYAL